MRTPNIAIHGAYGRIYKDLTEVQKDWEDNLDFKIHQGPYINKSDYKQYGKGQTIWFSQSKPLLKGSI